MATDISERTAGLNTQMRFGNYRKALSMAYGLRLDLQLAVPQNAKSHRELESVESVIENLERLKIGKFQRWAKMFWESIVESFQPPTEKPAEEGEGELEVPAAQSAEEAPALPKEVPYLGAGLGGGGLADSSPWSGKASSDEVKS